MHNRVREHAESIAFFGGDAAEQQIAQACLPACLPDQYGRCCACDRIAPFFYGDDCQHGGGDDDDDDDGHSQLTTNCRLTSGG